MQYKYYLKAYNERFGLTFFRFIVTEQLDSSRIF